MLIKLFISFFKIGAFSFGGGYAMLPFIQEEVIEVHKWLTATEFVDILAIAQMTPGPIALNSATFIGYRLGGVLGSLSATTAVVMPSFIIILTIAHFFNKFKESQNVQWAFKGIRPVVLGLIASAGISVADGTIVDIRSAFIAVSLFLLISFKKLHPILAIVVAGLMGVILY
ncbi:chromate transporter [Methanosarcina mazei]|uniref:Chromate transporter n=1 Tax=Methanosarcina mazei TaxID=2209 RepID=A0A0F8SA31_METMZ|nr:chromate transporter [Methanosarcina mazei]KKH70134.1 chromate transporter [Methanosarcina mazei]